MQQQAPLTGAGLSEVIALDALCVGRWTTDELQRGYSSRGAVGQRFHPRQMTASLAQADGCSRNMRSYSWVRLCRYSFQQIDF